MAKIPDALDMGGRVMPQAGAPHYEDRSGEIAADGILRSLSGINQAVQQYAQQDDAFNFARARSKLLSADADAKKALETDQDWQTHETRYNDGMKTAREEAAKLIKGDRSRALFESEAEADITRGAEGVRSNARKIEGEWGRSELDNLLETNRRAALESKDEASRGALVFGSQDAIQGALKKGYITPEQAVQARQAWTAQYGEGFVDMQPLGKQLEMLKKPKGTPADFIDPARRANLIERLEDKLKVVGDRREARAERALAQWERQIASGVPATAQMKADWGRTIAGTSLQGELDTLLKGEKEVQETLRKPINEQIRLVQQKQADLKTNGGTLQDAANVERLSKAVQQNVTMLQTTPMLFAEQRLDTPVDPIEMRAIVNPVSQAALASQFQERAATLTALEKRYGARVPMKPLMPQEAAEFASMLESASPDQAAALFAGLYNATGSVDVYKGAIGQIAVDSPVKAGAGLLAAKQRELVTESHWFKPDTTVTSQDVAGTILRGESILNPSKDDKKEDGKPKSAQLYLPQAAQADLQAKFENVVGDAYAGRPRALNDAYQTVQAYYVGRAAELGKIAGDKEFVDSALVIEAVRATQGNVIDYNDKGSVLAPWGMAEDDFEDRAEASLASELERNGYDPDAAGTFGLTNTAQDGIYQVTNGQNFLGDKQGKPMTVDLRRNNNRGRISRGGE